MGGGHFFWVPSFERGFGGDPLNFSKNYLYQKLLINNIEKVKKKSQEFSNHVSYAKISEMIISAKVGPDSASLRKR